MTKLSFTLATILLISYQLKLTRSHSELAYLALTGVPAQRHGPAAVLALVFARVGLVEELLGVREEQKADHVLAHLLVVRVQVFYRARQTGIVDSGIDRSLAAFEVPLGDIVHRAEGVEKLLRNVQQSQRVFARSQIGKFDCFALITNEQGFADDTLGVLAEPVQVDSGQLILLLLLNLLAGCFHISLPRWQ